MSMGGCRWPRRAPGRGFRSPTSRSAARRSPRSRLALCAVLAAGGSGGCRAGRLLGAAAAAGRAVILAVEGLAVRQDSVDLPGLAVRRAGHPELVLAGVAARRGALVDRGQPGLREPGLLGVDRVGVADLDAEVVEAAGLAGVLQQDELERRVGNREVSVAGPELGGLGAEQLAVEGDGLLKVADVERELDSGHFEPPHFDGRLCLTCRRACHKTSTSVNIDVCRIHCWCSNRPRPWPAARRLLPGP